DPIRCQIYTDELLSIAIANGLLEIEAVARRWRGEALFVEKKYKEAQVEFSHAARLADDIGRVRLQLDINTSLAKLFGVQGQIDTAQQYADRANTLADAIRQNIETSELGAATIP
ncbi:MAG TPA: hypothetical protein VIQ03_11980, partial [Gammaproteobacteria bacterium]